MRVPRVGVLVAHAALEQLHETDAVFDEPAREQTLAAERLGDRFVEAVQLLGGFRLAADVDRLRRAPLHAVRELVRRDPGRQIRGARELLHVELVELRQQIQTIALRFRRHSRDRLQVDDRIAARAEERSLIRSRHVACAPVGRTADRSSPGVGNHDERRQAGAFGAKTIRNPRTGARESHPDLPRLHLVVRLHVIVRAAEHGVDERDVVHVLAEVREHLGHQFSTLSVTLELERARHQRPGITLPDDDVAMDLVVDRLARVLDEAFLVVEEVDRARTTAHEERDHRLRTRLEMRRLQCVRIVPQRLRRAGVGDFRREQPLRVEHVRERHAADATAGSPQEFTTRPEIFHVVHGVTSCKGIR